MRKIIVTLIISCLFQATISQKNNIIEKTKVQAKIIDAKQSFLENNIKNSQLIYKEILALDPENTKAHYGLAKCYYKLHNYEKAKFHAETTYNSDPEIDDELNYLMAQTYFRLSELDNAKNKFNAFKNNISSDSKLNDYAIELKIKQVDYAKKHLENIDENIIIKNMGADLNSKGPEFAPSICNDGKYLMFTSRRDDTKGGGVDEYYDHQYYSDIYLSTWDESKKKWGVPNNNLGKINTQFHDGSLGFKPDNSLLIYRNIYGVTKSGDIYEAKTNKSEGWSTPKPILYKDKEISNKINSSYFESSASITSDESYIYFVSERKNGLGQADIYYVKRNDKSYSDPVNLGDKINTSGDEKCVFIHPSGKVLFFTSNGRENSMGSYDIYYCTGGPEKWNEPINMGAPINTTLEEKTINVSLDGNTAYVGGYYKIDNQGDADLYEIDISCLNILSK